MSRVKGPQDKARAIPYFRVCGLLMRNVVGWPTELEPATFGASHDYSRPSASLVQGFSVRMCHRRAETWSVICVSPKHPTRTPICAPFPRIRLTYAVYGRVTDGTRTRDLRSYHLSRGVAGVVGGCKPPIPKPFYFLCLALRCTVLRPRWC